MDESVQTKVTLGTNIQVTVLGKDSIDILTKKREIFFIHDVYYVSHLKHNMMSIGQFLQKGYILYMEDNHYVIMDICPRNQLVVRI